MRIGDIFDFRLTIADLSVVSRQLSVAKGGAQPFGWSVRRATGGRVRTTEREHRTSSSGFTLLELMIVMTLILILASMVTPTYHLAIVRAREAVLRDDLYTLRTLIDQYTIDKQEPPQALDDLVTAGYLRALPTDPFTQASDTWRVDIEEVPLNPQQGATGIVDVHSGSDETSTDGQTQYSSW